MAKRLHLDELRVDETLVRGLVDSQFPEYSQRPLARLDASGSTNVLFKLGADLLVRLPRLRGGSASIEKEHKWLPVVGGDLMVSVPEVVALGEPGCGYGERWSITTWLDGRPPGVLSPKGTYTVDRRPLAVDLARVTRTLRELEVSESALEDPGLRVYRGGSLADFDERMHGIIDECSDISSLDLDFSAARSVWQGALCLPATPKPTSWFHGDLVAENLLVDRGRLVGVLDFGGLGVGDPAIDLHGAWELFDPPARDVFRGHLELDDAEWLRGRAWALAVALMTIPYYWSKLPRRVEDRISMARSVLIDAARDDA